MYVCLTMVLISIHSVDLFLSLSQYGVDNYLSIYVTMAWTFIYLLTTFLCFYLFCVFLVAHSCLLIYFLLYCSYKPSHTVFVSLIYFCAVNHFMQEFFIFNDQLISHFTIFLFSTLYTHRLTL